MVDITKVKPGDKLLATWFTHNGILSSITPVPITVDRIGKGELMIVSKEIVKIAEYDTLSSVWIPAKLDYSISSVSETDPVCDTVYFSALEELFGGE